MFQFELLIILSLNVWVTNQFGNLWWNLYVAKYSTSNNLQVLVVGGGDGGVIREVSKHPAVESIVQCEIDEVSEKVVVWLTVLIKLLWSFLSFIFSLAQTVQYDF